LGFWFCNFSEFEKKKDRKNRLIINLYYAPDIGEEARKIKVYSKTNVRIPTGFIYDEEKAEELKQLIEKDSELKDFYLDEKKKGKYTVLEIEIPKEKRLIDKLPNKKQSEFQTGNYDRLLRFLDFYPERKFYMTSKLEKRLIENSAKQEKYEKTISRLKERNKKKKFVKRREKRKEKIKVLEENMYGDAISLETIKPYFEFEFPTEEEYRNMPWIYWDIEKPLWKKDFEKNWIKRRKNLLKKIKKASPKDKARIDSLVERLEKKLVVEFEGVGSVNLWEEKYDSAVSYIAAVWKNIGKNKEEIRELYLIDPDDNSKRENVNGYAVKKFGTEEELVKKFIEDIEIRKPVLSSGHNEVYDVTQVRFAADNNKQDFEPAVSGFKPRRDFVRYFFQRMREDLIYIDSMRIAANIYPFLMQRSLGTSLKLGDVAKFMGSDFEKPMNHEELRGAELKRLFGNTEKIRDLGDIEMGDYAAGDVDPVITIEEKSPFLSLITKLKGVLPHCTLTELAFAPGCMKKFHEYEHFLSSRNHRFYGRAQKIRENEIQIFKKRFESLKKKMLDYAGVSRKTVFGKHENIYEIYLPFEKWTKEAIYKKCPQFRILEKELNPEEEFGFFRYLKDLEKDLLVDYYFTRREGKIFKKFPIEKEKYQRIEELIEKENLDKYYGSFKFLKENFRGIYVSLMQNKGISLVRTSQKNLFDVDYPEYMEREADLFLVRKNFFEAMKKVTPGYQRVLKGFLTTLNNFENMTFEFGARLREEFPENDTEQLIFLYNQFRRKQKREQMFYAKWGLDVLDMTSLIKISYERLSHKLDECNANVIDTKGDYLFVTADKSIKENDYFYVVREMPEYEILKKETQQIKQKKFEKDLKNGQLLLFS